MTTPQLRPSETSPLGFLNIDKPQGMTSHDVVSRIRRLAGLKRVGHAGTLDPLATGVLVVGLGRATRLIEYVMGRPKIYRTTVRLGQTTDSYDADGEIVSERLVNVSDEQLEQALQQFRGEIEQIPPMFSAIKRNGQPLYKLARQGVTVERKARQVTISELVVEKREGDTVTLRIGCTTGTYIRSLAHDLGELLGCGGHVTMLRRLAVGDFSAETAPSLDILTPENIRSYLLPIDSGITHLQRYDLNSEEAKLLRFGKQIGLDSAEIPPATQLLRAYHTDSFFGILERRGSIWHPRKLFI